MSEHFFATVSRMKYIERWALMRNARKENLSEHSLEVAMIANVLCVFGNVRYHHHLNAEKAAVIAMYHDASEIITGDMPTPVKYGDEAIRSSYKAVEEAAIERLLEQLPEDLKPYYDTVLKEEGITEEEQYMYRLIKAADKMSAYIKCIEEKQSGNKEFMTAEITTRKKLEEMGETLPEVRDFMETFLPSYGETLDTLLQKEVQ